MAQNLIKIHHDLEEGVVLVEAPFSVGFNTALMVETGAWFEDGAWVIKEGYQDTVEELLHEYFPKIATSFTEA